MIRSTSLLLCTQFAHRQRLPWLPCQVRTKRELAVRRLAASGAPLNAVKMPGPSAMAGCRACSAGAGPRRSQPDGNALAHLHPLALRPQLLGMLLAVSNVPKPSLLGAGDSRMAAFLSQGQYRGIWLFPRLRTLSLYLL